MGPRVPMATSTIGDAIGLARSCDSWTGIGGPTLSGRLSRLRRRYAPWPATPQGDRVPVLALGRDLPRPVLRPEPGDVPSASAAPHRDRRLARLRVAATATRAGLAWVLRFTHRAQFDGAGALGRGWADRTIRVVGRVAVGDSSWLRSRRIPRSARPVREARRDRVADVSGAHGVQMAWRPAAPLSTPRGEPCCARQSVPHPTASLYAVVYFWDFKSYWTYPPNVVAFALVAALLTIGALPVSHTPARGVNGWPTLAQSIRQMVMAASASVDRAVFPRVTSPVDMRQMSH